MISSPLRDRFGMHFRLQFYTKDELSLIITKASHKLEKICLQDAAVEMARRSRGTPRIALRLLKRIRDYADVADEETINKTRAQYGLNELGVNDLGFDELDLKYLELLLQTKGRPLGLSTIAAALSEDEGTIEDVIEPYLLANNYIERTARGRIASPKTYELFRLTPPVLHGGLFEETL